MGYRSQVVIIVDPAYAPAFQKMLAESGAADSNESRELDCFQADSIKWYEDYATVVAITAFLKGLEELDIQPGYGFLRIGEADEDVETHGEPWAFGISVMRKIEIDR